MTMKISHRYVGEKSVRREINTNCGFIGSFEVDTRFHFSHTRIPSIFKISYTYAIYTSSLENN